MEFPIPRRGGLALMLGVLLVLGIAFAFYHFSHVSRQAEALRARNLRELALLARQAEDFLGAAWDAGHTMSPPCLELLRGSGSTEACKELEASTEEPTTWKLDTDRPRVITFRVLPGPPSEAPWIRADPRRRSQRLTLRLPVEDVELGFDLALDRLSLPVQYFDHLLLLDGDGRAILPRTQPGIRFSSLELDKPLPGRSHQQSILVAGREHTLFAQPLTFPQPALGLRGSASEPTWFVAGLVSTASLRAESSVLSPTTLLIVSCLLALLALSLPVLKIWVSKTHERVRRGDLVGLGTASALAMALIAILVADVYTYRSLLEASDETLRTVARTLRDRCLLVGKPPKQDPEVWIHARLFDGELAAALPPDMGFAVLDAQGVARLHSDPRRQGYESFLASTDRDGRLVEALGSLKSPVESSPRKRDTDSGAGPTPFSVRYQGQPYRMAIVPLTPDPFWLVVFYDQGPLRRLHLDVLLWVLSAALIYVLAAVGLSVLLALGWWLWRGRRDGLVGSGETFETGDHHLLYVLALLATTLLWMLFDTSFAAKLLAAVLVPLVALSFYLARLLRKRAWRAAPTEARLRWSWNPLEWAPVVLWGAAVVALGVLPESPSEIGVGPATAAFLILFCLLPWAVFGWRSIMVLWKPAAREHFGPTAGLVAVLAFVGAVLIATKVPGQPQSLVGLRWAVTVALLLLGTLLWVCQPTDKPGSVVPTRASWLERGGGVLLNALLFLLVVVALPTGLLFQTIWQAEQWTWVARGQRHLAKNLDQHPASCIADDLRSAFFSTQLEEGEPGPKPDQPEPNQPEPVGRDQVFHAGLPIWNLLERLHRNLPLDEHRQLSDGPEDSQDARDLRRRELMVRTADAERLKLILDPGSEDGTTNGKEVVATSTLQPTTKWKLLVPSSLAGLLGLGCLFAICWSARKLLVVDFGTGPSSPELPDPDDHLLWIGPRQDLQTAFPDKHRCQWIDLEDPAVLERLKAGKLRASTEVARVVLPGFEKLQDDPETLKSLLDQLAAWVQRDDLALVLASSEILPPDELLAAFRTEQTPEPAGTGGTDTVKGETPVGNDASSDTAPSTDRDPGTDRALALLASFTVYDHDRLGTPAPQVPANPDGSKVRRAWKRLEEQNQNSRLDRAVCWFRRAPRLSEMSRGELEQTFETAVCFYYRWIWSRCSDDERRVLFQLAEEGMINPAAGDIGRRLLRKGLATLPPHRGLAPMNETFRRWLRRVGRQERLREKEKATSTREGGWPEVRNPILLALALLSIFLLTTQQHLVGPTLGQVQQSFVQLATLFTAMAGGLAGLAQLVWRATSSG